MITVPFLWFGSRSMSVSRSVRPDTRCTPSVSRMFGDVTYACIRTIVPSPPAAFAWVELPPPAHGRKFVFATALMPGMPLSARTSACVVVMRKERSLYCSANGLLWTQRMLSSSKPDSFCICSRFDAIIVTAFAITARVMPICSTISSVRMRLRERARTIGPNSMASPFRL